MDTIRFGIIGCGLMAREFAGAAARWSQFTDTSIPRPEIVAVCSRSQKSRAWFTDRFPSVRFSTPDYRELLARPDIDAVYAAVPHDLHEEVYRAYTGESGSQARENLRRVLDRAGAERVMIRVPLIPGFNTPASQRETLRALKGLGVKNTDCFSYVVRDPD